ncbi:MAG: hypothetical protein IPG50_00085 [Myxococcales bacterium]|nr:hypothetical protein [Myxococcales bacterium]
MSLHQKHLLSVAPFLVAACAVESLDPGAPGAPGAEAAAAGRADAAADGAAPVGAADAGGVVITDGANAPGSDAGPATPSSATAAGSGVAPGVPTVCGKTYYGDPQTYRAELARLAPGDALVLAPGTYDPGANPPGLPIFGLHGAPGCPTVIMGDPNKPRPVFLGNGSYNTIRLNDASHVVIRHLEIDGRDLGGDGVNAQGVAHHITLEDLYVHGVGSDQQIVGISTKAPTWNFTIRGCEVSGAGTGMYLGNSDGTDPFVAGLLEHNYVHDTIGYNVQIKHQVARATVAGMPTNPNTTVLRHNVLMKGANSSTGGLARPNLLLGDVPPSGAGSSDDYLVYGNFFYRNPTENLFQAEGNVSAYHNVFFNDQGGAILIQPHNGKVRDVFVFENTVVVSSGGVSVAGGAAGTTQRVSGNVVYGGSLAGPNASDNVVGSVAAAAAALNAPTGALGTLDLSPKAGALGGAPLAASARKGLDADLDFNGIGHGHTVRGAYGAQGKNPGWVLGASRKP